MNDTIYGLLQIGVGVPDLTQSFAWYRKYLGMDIPVLRQAGDLSSFMLPLTNGQQPRRQLAIILNLHGGGGLELCQFTDRDCRPPAFEPRLGDCGINLARI